MEIILAEKEVSEYLNVNITIHYYPDYYYQYGPARHGLNKKLMLILSMTLRYSSYMSMVVVSLTSVDTTGVNINEFSIFRANTMHQ